MFEESPCQKSDCLLNHIFTVPLQKGKVKVSHAKTNHIFHKLKMPLQSLVFSVNKNLVCF